VAEHNVFNIEEKPEVGQDVTRVILKKSLVQLHTESRGGVGLRVIGLHEFLIALGLRQALGAGQDNNGSQPHI
jgi:hypothetical protein